MKAADIKVGWLYVIRTNLGRELIRVEEVGEDRAGAWVRFRKLRANSKRWTGTLRGYVSSLNDHCLREAGSDDIDLMRASDRAVLP